MTATVFPSRRYRSGPVPILAIFTPQQSRRDGGERENVEGCVCETVNEARRGGVKSLHMRRILQELCSTAGAGMQRELF